MYKFIYCCRLLEFGLSEEALHYCEVISTAICVQPGFYQLDFMIAVYNLASRLKYLDAHYLNGKGEIETMGDPQWLINLQTVIYHQQNQVKAHILKK